MEELITRKDVLALHTVARNSSSVPLGVPASPGSAWIDANEPSALKDRLHQHALTVAQYTYNQIT